MVGSLDFSVTEEWEEFARENPWSAFIPECAKDSDGAEYLRRKGNNFAYKKTAEGYECTDCGSEIMSAIVIHPIWDGPFLGSGSGRCHNEKVPYCPKCDEKPSSSGSPIQQ